MIQFIDVLESEDGITIQVEHIQKGVKVEADVHVDRSTIDDWIQSNIDLSWEREEYKGNELSRVMSGVVTLDEYWEMTLDGSNENADSDMEDYVRSLELFPTT